MRIHLVHRLLLALALSAATPAMAGAQATSSARPNPVDGGPTGAEAKDHSREHAESARGLRILISLSERRLWLKDGGITLHTAAVGVGKGGRLEHGGTEWSFETPRGVRQVLAKEENPVWVPPLWHYVELARQRGFRLVELRHGRELRLADGSRLSVRGETIDYVRSDGGRESLPAQEEIVFDGTLFVPPFGTAHRRIAGELGRYKLDLGDGYLLHGTREADSIGSASTHGCIRLGADDLELLYHGVPIGTKVYIY